MDEHRPAAAAIGESIGARSSRTGCVAGGVARRRGPRRSALTPTTADRDDARRPPRRARAGARARRPATPSSAPEHPRDHRRPAALPAVVLGRRRAALGLPPNLAAPAPGGGLLRPALHRLERLHARALDAADRPVHAPDRLHDHRREHARPGIPDLGNDAARARLPHALVRQVASHPPRQPLDADERRSARSSATASPAAPTPRPTARPGQGWHVDPHIAAPVRRLVRRTRAAPSRGARPSRSSTRTTSPGGTRGATASPPRPSPRASCGACRPTSRRPSCCSSATSRACSARFRTPRPPRSARCRSTARNPSPRWLAFLDLYVKLQLEVDRHIGRRPAHARKPPRGGREHGDRVHLRPRRVRRLARPARQGRERLRGGHPRAADRQGPPRRAHQRHPNSRARSSARASTSLRCCSRSPPAPTTGGASATTPTSPAGSTSRRSSPTPKRRGRPYVLHATDETVTEFAIEPYAAERAAARRRDAHARRPSTRPTPTGPIEGITPLSAGRGKRAV